MRWREGMRVENDRFTSTVSGQVFTATVCPGKLRVSAPNATVTLFLIPEQQIYSRRTLSCEKVQSLAGS